MKKQIKRNFYWRKLDDQAKVFSLASNSKYCSVFRLSVILKMKVEEEILQKALESTIEKYKVFKVKMRKGLFWYYLEENPKSPIITIEKDYPFRKINTKENNDYLFKVTYFENKINVEFFHALTDGNGGALFLKDLVYRYLEIKYSNELDSTYINEEKILQESENAYKKNYKKHIKKDSSLQRAYKIQGELLPKGQVAINHFNINLDEFKKNSKSKGCTLSMYIVSMIAYSIYEENYRLYEGKKPLNLCIPINLKKYFPSETISNFFSYMMVNLNFRKHHAYSFDKIQEFVKKEFDKKLKLEKILETMSSDAGMTNNIFVRIVPLMIKKIAVRLGSLEVKRHFTMTISNIGPIQIDNKYSKYIEKFLVILSPDWAEGIKCGICSYENNLIVTFATLLKESNIEKRVSKLLLEDNIEFRVEGNGVNVISE